MGSRAWFFAIVLGLGAAVAGAPPAAGQSDDGAVLLILDASGSMNATDDAGVRLIDGAQQALVRLVEQVPEGAPVGLRVYGHRVPEGDKANGCLDTELIVPVGPLQRGQMIDAIGSFTATGYTPIGLSLQQAASDLPDGGGTIVLVSDGEDTCAPPDPCEVAAGLIENGIDVRVHTVGLFLEQGDPAREQLQCIAGATGATYRDVGEIDALSGELGRIVVQSIPGIGNIHLPVKGALALADAPLLDLVAAPEDASGNSRFGAFAALLPPNQAVWYAIELDGPSQLGVGGGVENFVPGAVAGDTLEVVIADDSGAEVQLWESRWGRPSVVLAELVDPQQVNFGANTGIGFDNLWSWMATEERQQVEILGYDEESHDATVRELTRRPEPSRAGPGTYYVGFTWNTATESDSRSLDFFVSTWSILGSVHLRYQSVAGSSEAEAAPLLQPSGYARGPIGQGPGDAAVQGGYFGDIERGATIWYALPVERDEQLAVRAFLDRPEGASAAAGERFSVELYDPEMRRITQPHDDRQPAAALDDPGALDSSFLPSGLAPRPLVGAAIPSLPGRGETNEGIHHIAFTWDGPADGTSAEVEFIVNLFGGEKMYVEGALDRLAAPIIDVDSCLGRPGVGCIGFDTFIGAGETRWLGVEAMTESRVLLATDFFPPVIPQPGEADELRLSIIFEDGTDVTFGHDQWPVALDLDAVLDAAHAEAVSVCAECNPPVAAQAGTYYLGVTWDSKAASIDVAPLAMWLEVQADPGMLPSGDDSTTADGSLVGSAAESEGEDAAAGDSAGEGQDLTAGQDAQNDGQNDGQNDAQNDGQNGGRVAAVAIVVLMAALGVGLLLWRRARRSSNRSD